jgi:hypothetical protein
MLQGTIKQRNWSEKDDKITEFEVENMSNGGFAPLHAWCCEETKAYCTTQPTSKRAKSHRAEVSTWSNLMLQTQGSRGGSLTSNSTSNSYLSPSKKVQHVPNHLSPHANNEPHDLQLCAITKFSSRSVHVNVPASKPPQP